MKSINELVNLSDLGWTIVEEWISTANKPVDVLKADKESGRIVLYDLQVTTKSIFLE